MYLFFGDERKSSNNFSLLFFCIKKSNTAKIEELTANFRLKKNLSKDYEFHYHINAKFINKLFAEFIRSDLIDSGLIENIFYSQIDFISEPLSHVQAFKNIAPLISIYLNNQKARFIFDKLGGEKTEAILKTEINRLCGFYKINTYKPASFNNSKKSDFIQIADYLVALKDKGLIQ